MAIGRTFKEALQKAVRSLEQDRWGLTLDRPVADLDELRQKIRIPNADRCFAIGEAYRRGLGTREIHELTAIDPWFLDNIREIVEFEADDRRAPALADRRRPAPGQADGLRRPAPRPADRPPRRVRSGAPGRRAGIKPVYQDGGHLRRRVRGPHALPLLDLRGGGRGARRRPREKVVILGGGPNRIGQGIEFDYCCVHAAFALKEAGVEAIMVNCNPETVSTDYDTSDRLYFEPLTLEDVLNIVERGAAARASSCSSAGRRRSSWRCRSSRPACRSSARRPTPSTAPRTASASPSSSTSWGSRQAPGATARSLRGGGAHRRPTSATRCWCGPPTCWAGGPCRSSTTRPDLERYMTEAVRVEPGAPDPGRQVPGGRHRDRRGRHRDGERGGGRRGHGAHREGRGPLGRLGLRAAALLAGRRPDRAHPGPDPRAGPRARRGRAHQHPVRDQERGRSTSSRSTRAPPAPCPSSPRPSACRWPSWPPR